MSKIDRIKEELGWLKWLKVVFTLLVAVGVSLVAWLYEHYEHSALIVIVCVFLGLMFLTAAIIWVNRAAMSRFKKLEE